MGYILLSKEYINAKTKLEYICPKHSDKGVQSITFNNIRAGFGCKYCGRERTTEARKLTFSEVYTVFAKHDMILLNQPYINAITPMKYICLHHPKAGIQKMSVSNAYRQHCPSCNKSKGESKISEYLFTHKIKFEEQKKYDKLVGDKNGQLSFDFYLPEYNLLIEYQGEQHAKSISIFGGESQLLIQQKHDKRKRMFALKNNIQLLEIWYYEFNDIEIIIKNVLRNIA